jgi:outer membrane protein assembly factor BamB
MEKNYFKLSLITIAFLMLSCSKTDDISQWRGPNRDGIFPEKNLLKAWPENGPEMVWVYKGLGAGHGSVSIGNDKIFVLGMPDTTGVLYALDLDGNLLWEKEYGEEWHQNYTGPRSTPTIAGNMVYFLSGQGVVYCYDISNGEKIWSVDILKKFNAENIRWGVAETLLLDGDRLFCTPGGEEHNFVALNRFTGETIWTSPGNRQPAAYCSPVLINHNNSSLIVTIAAASIICIDAQTGEFYWEVPQAQVNNIHANTPVYYEGRLYCSSAQAKENGGMVALSLSEDGKAATVEWRNESFTSLMGGIVIRDGHIYGSKYRSKYWNCIDTSDGKIVYDAEGLADGVVIWADGLFYCYTTTGEMALVDANPSSFNIISKFKITHGTDQHWAHPVIHNGRLYVRHGNALMAYDIKSK